MMIVTYDHHYVHLGLGTRKVWVRDVSRDVTRGGGGGVATRKMEEGYFTTWRSKDVVAGRPILEVGGPDQGGQEWCPTVWRTHQR